MTTTKDGGPAFPESYIGADIPHEGIGGGMTLRDYFAAHAPAPPDAWYGGGREREVDDVIAWRWRYADRMLKAR